jgi:polygalacturonase
VANALRPVAHHFFVWDVSKGRVGHIVLASDATRLKIEGLTLRHAGSWTVRWNRCDDVALTSLTIRNPMEAPCMDGIDPCDSSNDRIEHCDIETSDDAVCFKSMTKRGMRNLLV